MTLVLGIVCAEGVVLASDSQATYSTGGQPIKGNITKLYPQWNSVAWAASGNVGVAQYASQLFKNHAQLSQQAYFENRTPDTAQKEICGALRGPLRQYFQGEIMSVQGSQPETSFLFCGSVKGGAVLFEIGADLIVTDHREQGYAAIGSGDIFPYFALASLAHHNLRECSLSRASLIAHRVVDDAIRVAAFGLGPPVQMITIPNGDQADVRDDIEAIKAGVAQWKSIETAALDKYLEAPAGEDGE